MSTDENNGGRADRLAPVIPLFGDDSRAVVQPVEASPSRRLSWHTTWSDDAADSAQSEAERSESDAEAEAALLKKLRARSLSVKESRSFLVGEGLTPEAVDAVVGGLLRHGYLDDVRLAEQLVYSGSVRKGQGRQAIARTLTQRGIPRELADAALSETEDDDAERALEFARHKASAFRGIDRETALRRLVGQLSRRGYPGQVAMTAARTALEEISAPRVRFE